MKISTSILLITALALPARAQENINEALREIENNNLTLIALREQTNARVLENKTGNSLPDPEVGFNFLWGNPTAVGVRKDFSVTQGFDFPTAYVYRSKIAELGNATAELWYRQERMNLLLEAKKTIIEIIYYNRLIEEHRQRLKNATAIAEAFEKQFNAGEASIIDLNNAKLSLASVKGDMAMAETRRASLLRMLETLNGGHAMKITDLSNPAAHLPADFDQWVMQAQAHNPLLQSLESQALAAKQQVKLERALAMPKLSAGYMSEKVTGERYGGLTVSASIPLWESKNRVRHAKAEEKALESIAEDNRTTVLNNLRDLYMLAATTANVADNYRIAVDEHNNTALLKKALEAGEITLPSYLQEMEYYFSMAEKLFEAERDFQLAMAALTAIEL